jgi:hypothetical protein
MRADAALSTSGPALKTEIASKAIQVWFVPIVLKKSARMAQAEA